MVDNKSVSVFYVDYTGKISNLLEDIKKVERFVQYIEKQGSGNLTEMENTEPSKTVKNKVRKGALSRL